MAEIQETQEIQEVQAGGGSLKIIGAGFGRTGTLSLKVALEELNLERAVCYATILIIHQLLPVRTFVTMEQA